MKRITKLREILIKIFSFVFDNLVEGKSKGENMIKDCNIETKVSSVSIYSDLVITNSYIF